MYAFKLNPKQAVEQKVRALWGKEVKCRITGNRPTLLECKATGQMQGHYYVEANVCGQLMASAHHRNWRMAYKMLLPELEKTFAVQMGD